MSLFKRLLMEKHLLLVLSICLISILTIKTVPAKAVYGGINLETPVAAGLNAGYLYAEVDSSISNYGHHGTDWRATLLPVKAAYNGKVITVTDLGNTSYGKYIIIESDHPDYPGTKFYHLYAHLSRQDVSQGQTVTKGQQIGVSGNTGGVGYHLHFEIRMGSNSWYAQRNPEGLLARSTSDGYGGVYGRVKTSSDAWVRRCRISGASKPTDYNYGATYTYALMANGNPFPDESAYGINYYIGRASTGTVTLSYNNGAKTQVVTIRPNTDFLVSTVYLP